MGFLFARPKTSIPEFTGLQIQTAVNVLPIPLVYGCPRIQQNIVYANGFYAKANKGSGKGKGLLTGGKDATQGYSYFATFIGAICEGEVGPIRAIFDNQQVYTLNNLPAGKIYTFFNGGSDNSAPWTVVSTSWPSDAFAYKNTAYVGCWNYPLDSSATIPQLNYILEGLFQGTSPLNLYTAPDATTLLMDADPAEVIFDFLTESTHGATFPVAYIDQDTLFTSADGLDPGIGDAALSTYCQAVGFGWSVVLNNPEPASSVIQRWCKNLVVAPVWTGSILKFIPFYDTFANGNPGYDIGSGLPLKYYKPNTIAAFDLNDDVYEQSPQSEDPLTVSRIDIADVKNVVRIDFRDRNNLFNDNVSEAKDESGVELYGPRVDRMGTADEFTFVSYAAVSAQTQLQRNISIRNTYEFKLSLKYCVLDPMDILLLTDISLGLNKFPVRIKSIEEDEKGVLSISAEEFPIGALTNQPFIHQANTPPTDANVNTPANSVNTPFIFEPTAQMLIAQSVPNPTIIIGTSGGPSGTFDVNWGGVDIWLSNDDVTYTKAGRLTGPSRQGVTTAALAAYSGSNPDNTHTLSVNLTESDAELESATSTQASMGLTLCAIAEPDGSVELLSYQTATLTAPNAYDLTHLYRGLYGTVVCSHLSGSQFLRVDTAVFQDALPASFVNELVYVKLQSFNIYGNGFQDLGSCTAYQYTPSGAGTNLALDPILSALLAGTAVDLNTATDIYGGVDLNQGGAGPCAPSVLSINLGGL